MANVLFGGFKPVLGLQARARRYEVASGNSTAIFRGDVVKADSAGVVDVAAAGNTDLVGVVKEVEYTLSGKRVRAPYLPASTTYSPTARGSVNASYVWVYDDPAMEYWVCVSSHANTDTEAEVRAALFCNMDITAGAGSTVYGQSGHTLDGAVVAATAQFRILEIRRIPGNDLAAANFQVRCMINEGFHAFVDTAGA
jgi:hypothetical protein